MQKFTLALFLCCSLLVYGQDTSNKISSSVDSLTEKGIPDLASIDTKAKESLFDYFSKKDILEFTIKADFDTLLEHKKRFSTYIPGVVSFENIEGELDTLKVNLRPRGKFRRMVCDFPPLRVKFKKKGLRKLGLNDEFNTFKVVTHCLEDKKDAKKNILKEYLLYQLYALHSEHSLRAQLVKVTYIQKGSEKELYQRYGILLESEKELAHRSSATLIDRINCSIDSLHVFEGTVHSMFQCMIGNADWSISGMRNVKLMRLKDDPLFTIYPYDFDFSGFVEASYAIPNPDYQLTSTRHRVYLGKIYSDEEMRKVADYFLSKKDATIELCKNFEGLSKKCRRDVVKYLDSFYKILEDEEQFVEQLNSLCPKKL